MEISNKIIIEKAALIIMNSGMEALSIHNLASELEVEENKLYPQFKNDDDILHLLLLEFEAEIIEFTNDIASKAVSPETELKLLFNSLYFLFLKKPFYLAIIFDKSLMEKDKNIKLEFLQIKSIAEEYLTKIIIAGKKENIFLTEEPIRVLVGRILSSFRMLMRDEQRVNEMIIELKTLKTTKD